MQIVYPTKSRKSTRQKKIENKKMDTQVDDVSIWTGLMHYINDIIITYKHSTWIIESTNQCLTQLRDLRDSYWQSASTIRVSVMMLGNYLVWTEANNHPRHFSSVSLLQNSYFISLLSLEASHPTQNTIIALLRNAYNKGPLSCKIKKNLL